MMDDATRNELAKLFPAAAVEVGELYGPAVARMALREVLALRDCINAKQAAEAQELVRSKMTKDELATEKEKLADLTRVMAEEQAQAWQVGKSIVLLGLKVGVTIGLGMVGL